jgi:copper transport protein
VILPAWSRWAALAVVWLVGAGVVQAVVQLGSFGTLFGTAYGRVLLAKVGVLAGVLIAAAYARRLVARARGTAGLGRTVGIELAATSVVLALSAVLVQATPGRAVRDEPAAGTGAGVSQTLTSDLFTLQFHIYPGELGEYNTVHGFTYTPQGRPLTAAEMTVSTRLVAPGMEAVSEPMLPLAPRNDSVGSIAFPRPGTYEIAFTVRVSEIDQATVRTSITVPQVPSPG